MCDDTGRGQLGGLLCCVSSRDVLIDIGVGPVAERCSNLSLKQPAR